MPAPRVKDAIFLILAQAATKAFTFVLNQLLLRRITPEVFGVAAYFEFISNTVLFFSREAERMTIQRIQGHNAENTLRAIVNFAYLPFLLSWPIFGVIYYLQKSSELYTGAIATLPNHQWIVAILVFLVELELLSEPLYSLVQFKMDMKMKSKAESLAVFMKCITTFTAIVALQKESFDMGNSILAFALGHMAYACTIFVQYWLNYTSKYPVPKRLTNGSFLDASVVPMFRSLCLQMIFKHLLTEGDTLLISYLFTVSEQGVYSVISNYGSLLARLLFQPIEETLRVSMTKMFASKDQNTSGAYDLMVTIMVFYTNLCVLVVLGGYTNGPYMLRLVLGDNVNWQKSDVFAMFPNYILYIPFMAFNGVLEAFLSSAATHHQINQFSFFMSLLSVAVLAFLHYLISYVKMGICGLILSNVVNMTLRIIYCCFFIALFFNGKAETNVCALVKRLSVPIVLGSSTMFIQSMVLGHLMTTSAPEFLTSLIFCFTCLVGILWNERILLLTTIGMRKKKHEKM